MAGLVTVDPGLTEDASRSRDALRMCNAVGMAGYSYGSRRELLQYIVDPGHRQAINRGLIEENVELREFAASPAGITWVSPNLNTGKELRDGAWEVVGLRTPSPQSAGWWPTSGPAWDAVASVRGNDGSTGAIFIEAKGRAAELRSGGCRSANPSSIKTITEALHDVQSDLGVPIRTNWLGPAYQPANRLAWLWFGRCHEEHRFDPLPIWLVSIYFCGVHYRSVNGIVGPPGESAWRPEIDRLHAEMRLPENHPLSSRCIELFLPSIVTEMPD
jgi:hypothetical protein